METQLFASFGFVMIGIVSAVFIYAFGARRLHGTAQFQNAVRWTLAFAISVCTFCGTLPFLHGYDLLLSALPLLGVALSLNAIERMTVDAVD